MVFAQIFWKNLKLYLADFNKISKLINHISSHIEEGDSILDFLEFNYGVNTAKHNREHSEHRELHFKHKHLESHFQIVFIFYVQNYPINFNEIKLETNNFTYKEPTTDLFTNNFLSASTKVT